MTGKVERAQAANQRDNDEELLDQTEEKNASRNTHNLSGRINLCASGKSHGIKS
jgi:hypothetical protein